jgi:arabinan endo-1,5-alpha-L-arabinosidase
MVLLGLEVAVYCAETKVEPMPLEGQTFLHDPSTVLKENGRYYLFATGRGIATKSSPDLISWTNGPAVFSDPPAWTTNAVPGYRGHTWAPDVIHLNGQYHLYYSVSMFGKQVSAIGLATNPTLDPSSPDYRWTDHGPVIQSTNGSPFNAIDPCVTLDGDGRLWMAFGSFWKGLYLVELDSQTGLRLGTNSPVHRLAWNEMIEAPCLTHHNDFHYLFVNWGRCCRGTNSTYEVRVGRSKTITGPYLDRDGISLEDGGGTLFLETTGRFIGPGHIGILSERGMNWFSYHYYDAESNGRSRLALGQLRWTEDGWPVAIKAGPLPLNLQ